MATANYGTNEQGHPEHADTLHAHIWVDGPTQPSDPDCIELDMAHGDTYIEQDSPQGIDYLQYTCLVPQGAKPGDGIELRVMLDNLRYMLAHLKDTNPRAWAYVQTSDPNGPEPQPNPGSVLREAARAEALAKMYHPEEVAQYIRHAEAQDGLGYWVTLGSVKAIMADLYQYLEA